MLNNYDYDYFNNPHTKQFKPSDLILDDDEDDQMFLAEYQLPERQHHGHRNQKSYQDYGR